MADYVIRTGYDAALVLSEQDSWVDPAASTARTFATFAQALDWLITHRRCSRVLFERLPTVCRRDELLALSQTETAALFRPGE